MAFFGVLVFADTDPGDNPGQIIDNPWANLFTTEVTTEAPTEEPSTEAPSVEPSTEAPSVEPSTEAPSVEPSTEAPTFVPGIFTPIDPDNFTVVEEIVEEGQVTGRWFQVSGYEVYLGYWDNASGQAMIDSSDPDTIKFQQLSSNWWSEWGTQVRKTVSGLKAGEEYTLTLSLKGSVADGKYVTSDNPAQIPITTDAQTVTIKATADDNGDAKFTIGTGYIGTACAMDFTDVVVKDSEGTQVYPSEEPSTEAPSESPTVEPSTEAPTVEPTTEAPTQEPTTQAPTQEPTTQAPTQQPTAAPTVKPSVIPTPVPVVKVPGKAKIKKVYKKKKSAKKIKLKIKKIKGAKGYQVAVYKSKKKAKKNKKALVKKYVKNKKKVTVKSKKLKGKKKLFIRARAYVLDGNKKVFGPWSKVKKVKIKK